jgi:hypothetical protein
VQMTSTYQYGICEIRQRFTRQQLRLSPACAQGMATGRRQQSGCFAVCPTACLEAVNDKARKGA